MKIILATLLASFLVTPLLTVDKQAGTVHFSFRAGAFRACILAENITHPDETNMACDDPGETGTELVVPYAPLPEHGDSWLLTGGAVYFVNGEPTVEKSEPVEFVR